MRVQTDLSACLFGWTSNQRFQSNTKVNECKYDCDSATICTPLKKKHKFLAYASLGIHYRNNQNSNFQLFCFHYPSAQCVCVCRNFP